MTTAQTATLELTTAAQFDVTILAAALDEIRERLALDALDAAAVEEIAGDVRPLLDSLGGYFAGLAVAA